MISIFTCPKPFRGEDADRQMNALESWSRMSPEPELILVGDDPGVERVADRLGATWVEEVERNPAGTPLVSDLFEKGQAHARYDHLAYINTDIITLSSFAEALDPVAARLDDWLVVGRRWDLDLEGRLEFEHGDWRRRLREEVEERGRLHGWTGLDYFLFRKGLYPRIPPFAIGRFVWDNWLVYAARKQGVPVVDATDVVTIVHQNHGYGHLEEGDDEDDPGETPEIARNRRLAGTRVDTFCVADASYVLREEGLHRATGLMYVLRRLFNLGALRWWARPLRWLFFLVGALTRPFRRSTGLLEWSGSR